MRESFFIKTYGCQMNNYDSEKVNDLLLFNGFSKADDIEKLIKNAETAVEESTSLYEYTREVNDNFDYESKLNLVDQLWRIAFADGHLDKFEEHVVRKIADLIHISHNDFIQSKLKNRN